MFKKIINASKDILYRRPGYDIENFIPVSVQEQMIEEGKITEEEIRQGLINDIEERNKGGDANLDPEDNALKGAGEIRQKTIVITGGKGGTGKTLITAQLALRMIAMGKRVFLLDWDPSPKLKEAILGHNDRTQGQHSFTFQGTSSLLYTIGQYSNLYSLVNSIFMPSSNLFKIVKDYDVILIDNSAGNELHETILSNLFNTNLIVSNTEPTALNDAAAHICTLAAQNSNNPQNFYTIFNNINCDYVSSEGFLHRQALEKFCKNFLATYQLGSKLFSTSNVPPLRELAKQPYIKNQLIDVPAIDILIEIFKKLGVFMN